MVVVLRQNQAHLPVQVEQSLLQLPCSLAKFLFALLVGVVEQRHGLLSIPLAHEGNGHNRLSYE